MSDARQLTAALAGRWRGGYGTARCPAHEDRRPSLAIRNGEGGRLLVRCHAGCHQRAVIEALRARGLWGATRPDGHPFISINLTNWVADDGARVEMALRIWRASRPASGTLVETYLRSRRLDGPIPPTIRYHPRLRHRPSGRTWPAMVAAMQARDRQIVGVHRTWIRPDGTGKADVELPRMTLGPYAGGAIRLAPVGESLLVGEGIETCLAAMLATGQPTWAGGSTSGLTTLLLPIEVRHVVILADGDGPGERAALEAAGRWAREGRSVRIARPPRGWDSNDILVGRRLAAVGSAAA